MRYLALLVENRHARRWEYKTLRHLQRRMERAKTFDHPVVRAAAIMDVVLVAQSAACAAAISRVRLSHV